jgi:hypothetical protein
MLGDKLSFVTERSFWKTFLDFQRNIFVSFVSNLTLLPVFIHLLYFEITGRHDVKYMCVSVGHNFIGNIVKTMSIILFIVKINSF